MLDEGQTKEAFKADFRILFSLRFPFRFILLSSERSWSFVFDYRSKRTESTPMVL